MIVQIFFISILTITSIKSIIYIKTYVTLLKFGAKTEASIIAFEASNFMMTKNATIPKINFTTVDDKTIMEKPIHSWFVELNKYVLNKNCIVFYDKESP